jgi:NADH:ubiquinone oxidoreductase subunit K
MIYAAAAPPLAVDLDTIQYYLAAGPDHLINYLLISGILLVLGVFILVTRRNAVAMLMGVEFILNAAALNFVAFSRFPLHFGPNLSPDRKAEILVDGHVFTLFIIILAAAEAAVALALILAVFQTHDTIDLDKVDELSS